MSTPTVALTGAGGFIGSRMLRDLHEGGVPVRALLGPPTPDLVDPPPGVDARYGSLDDTEALTWLLDGSTTVVHLAGPASVARSFERPMEYRSIHVGGTAALCRAAGAGTVRRFVYVSSAEVYGRPARNPVDERAVPAPRSPYASAKVDAESSVREVGERLGWEVVVVRPFLVYGHGMAPWSLIGSLVQSASAGGPLRVADPRPVRDYVHVSDVVRALGRCATTPGLGVRPVTLNLCSGVGRSVAEVAALVAAVAGVPLEDRPRPADRPPASDIPELVGDPSAAAEVLGWVAEATMQSGLAAMLDATLSGKGRS